MTMGVLSCFIRTPKRDKDSHSAFKLSEELSSGDEVNYGDDGGISGKQTDHGESSDQTVAVRVGGSSIDSCGSTNVPHLQSSGNRTWAQLNQLADEVAELRKRLQVEEMESKQLRDEVSTLRSRNAVFINSPKSESMSGNDKAGLPRHPRSKQPGIPKASRNPDIFGSKDSVNTPDIKSTDGFVWSPPASPNVETSVEQRSRDDLDFMQRNPEVIASQGSEQFSESKYVSCDSQPNSPELAARELMPSKSCSFIESNSSCEKPTIEICTSRQNSSGIPPSLPQREPATIEAVVSHAVTETAPLPAKPEAPDEPAEPEEPASMEAVLLLGGHQPRDGRNTPDSAAHDGAREQAQDLSDKPAAETVGSEAQGQALVQTPGPLSDSGSVRREEQAEAKEEDTAGVGGGSPAAVEEVEEYTIIEENKGDSLNSDPSLSPAAGLPGRDSSDSVVIPLKSSLDSEVSFAVLTSQVGRIDSWGFNQKHGGSSNSSEDASVAKLPSITSTQLTDHLGRQQPHAGDEFEFKMAHSSEDRPHASTALSCDPGVRLSIRTSVEGLPNGNDDDSDLSFKERSPRKVQEGAIAANKTVWESESHSATNSSGSEAVFSSRRADTMAGNECQSAPAQPQAAEEAREESETENRPMSPATRVSIFGENQNVDGQLPLLPAHMTYRRGKVTQAVAPQARPPLESKEKKVDSSPTAQEKKVDSSPTAQEKKIDSSPTAQEKRDISPTKKFIGHWCSRKRSPSPADTKARKVLEPVAVSVESDNESFGIPPAPHACISLPKSKSPKKVRPDSKIQTADKQEKPPAAAAAGEKQEVNAGSTGNGSEKANVTSSGGSPTFPFSHTNSKSSPSIGADSINKGQEGPPPVPPLSLVSENDATSSLPTEVDGGAVPLSPTRSRIARFKSSLRLAKAKIRKGKDKPASETEESQNSKKEPATSAAEQSEPPSESENRISKSRTTLAKLKARVAATEERSRRAESARESCGNEVAVAGAEQEGGEQVGQAAAPEAADSTAQEESGKKDPPKPEIIAAVERALEMRLMQKKKQEAEKLEAKLIKSPEVPADRGRDFNKWIGDGIDIASVQQASLLKVELQSSPREAAGSPQRSSILMRRSFKGMSSLRNSTASAEEEAEQVRSNLSADKREILKEWEERVTLGAKAAGHGRPGGDERLEPEEQQRTPAASPLQFRALSAPRQREHSAASLDDASEKSSVKTKSERKFRDKKAKSPRSPKQRIERVSNWLEAKFSDEAAPAGREPEKKEASLPPLDRREFSPISNSMIHSFISGQKAGSSPVSPRSVRQRSPGPHSPERAGLDAAGAERDYGRLSGAGVEIRRTSSGDFSKLTWNQKASADDTSPLIGIGGVD